MSKLLPHLIIGFTKWLKQRPGTYADYQVGVATDPEGCLRRVRSLDEVRHHVSRFDIACTADTARRVERYFLDRGMRGASEGGDADSRAVFMYGDSPDSREQKPLPKRLAGRVRPMVSSLSAI